MVLPGVTDITGRYETVGQQYFQSIAESGHESRGEQMKKIRGRAAQNRRRNRDTGSPIVGVYGHMGEVTG